MHDASDDLVTLASFADMTEAMLAKDVLETNSIRVFLADENSAGLGLAVTGGIRLMVAGHDVEAAQALLTDALWSQPGDEEKVGIATPETLEKIAHNEREDAEEPPTWREKQGTQALIAAICLLLFLLAVMGFVVLRFN